MKYSVNPGSISGFVKIVNFVRQATAKDQIGLMAVYMKMPPQIVDSRAPGGRWDRPIGTQRR